MSAVPDPVGQGLIASLARPGGNTTGLTLDAEELAGKQVELLKEAVPTLSRIAVLRNASEVSDAARRQIEAAARTLMLEVKEFLVKDAKDLAPTFEAMSQARVGAILVRRDTLVVERSRAEVVELAARRRLPAMYSFREFPDSGGS
jgi:putative ABC transport system substrate-binding protein